MNGLSYLFASLGIVVLTGTIGAFQPDARNLSDPEAPNTKAVKVASDREPLILIVDGAGDLKGCSNALRNAAELYQIRLDVETFPWSHGYRKLLKDQIDTRHFRVKGKELADRIAILSEQRPDRPIVLVSYSAGCSVALAACAYLPADTLYRQILLAPSVSTRYDLRPALRSARMGLDVYCSKVDRWALGLVIRCVGTADELRDTKAAGRYGFETIAVTPSDTALYQRLRHHFWSSADERLGHEGRHHGMHAPAFVKEKIIDLFPLGTRQ